MHDRSDEIRWRVRAAEGDDLRRIGDLMQSESSRLVEWAEQAMRLHPTTLEMPYEVRMAVLGVKSAVTDWTHARTFNWPEMIREQLDAEENAEPTDEQIYNGHGMEGGIPYGTPSSEAGA